MRRTVLLLGAVASAHAFSMSPMAIRGAPAARSGARSGATCVKMDDTASMVIAALPGLAALGVSLQNGTALLRQAAYVELLCPASLVSFI